MSSLTPSYPHSAAPTSVDNTPIASAHNSTHALIPLHSPTPTLNNPNMPSSSPSSSSSSSSSSSYPPRCQSSRPNRRPSSASLYPPADRSPKLSRSLSSPNSDQTLPPTMRQLEEGPDPSNSNSKSEMEKAEDARERLRKPKVWPPWKRPDGWAGWAAESPSTMSLVPSLVTQAFSTGILDATTYADFSTFASNQTGNTILLTVSVIGTIRVLLLLTGVSLASFLLGAFTWGHLGHHFGVRRRSFLLLSLLYQLVLLAISAVLLSPLGPAATQIHGTHEWLPLCLFAQMSGAQVAMARQSQCQELPTAPMTSTYVDLVSDKYLFVGWNHPQAGPRNRRAMYVGVMVAGGFLGAVLHRWGGSWVVVLVTMGLKAAVGVMFCTAEP